MIRRDGPLLVIGDALLDHDLDGTATQLASEAPVPVVENPITLVRPGAPHWPRCWPPRRVGWSRW